MEKMLFLARNDVALFTLDWKAATKKQHKKFVSFLKIH